jgi:hypothetical protein
MNRSAKFWDRVSNKSDKPLKKLEQTYIKIVENGRYLTAVFFAFPISSRRLRGKFAIMCKKYLTSCKFYITICLL